MDKLDKLYELIRQRTRLDDAWRLLSQGISLDRDKEINQVCVILNHKMFELRTEINNLMEEIVG